MFSVSCRKSNSVFDFFAKLNKRPIVDVSWHDYGAKDHGKAGIAQLVEHLICNQGVPGSNPGAGTIIIKDLAGNCQVLV